MFGLGWFELLILAVVVLVAVATVLVIRALRR